MDGEKFLGERIKVQFSNQNKLNANRDKGCYKCGSVSSNLTLEIPFSQRLL